MEQLKVIRFLEENKELFFPNEKYSDMELENSLLETSRHFEARLMAIRFKSPSTTKAIAIFPGVLGIDRLYLGDYKNAALKYITFGGVLFWWIKDIKSAEERCRIHNCEILLAEAKKYPKGTFENADNQLDINKLLENATQDVGNESVETKIESSAINKDPESMKVQTGGNQDTIKKVLGFAKKAMPIFKAVKKGAKDVQDSLEVK